jgi:hypothetical protein
MRCYIILIACDWLLLMAPEKLDGSFELSRPLGEWTQIQFFDTANDCNQSVERATKRAIVEIDLKRIEEYRRQLNGDSNDPIAKLQAGKAALQRVLDEGMIPEQKALQQRQGTLKTASRCIPTDAIDFPLR